MSLRLIWWGLDWREREGIETALWLLALTWVWVS